MATQTSRGDRCPTCRRRIKRSNPQNARYWALVFVIAEKLQPKEQTYSPETWHLYLKNKFLGADDVKLPSGKVITIPRSTADLDVAEFGDYMDKVQAWANEHDCWLEDGAFA